MKFKKSQILSWKVQKVSCSGKSCIQKFTWILLFRQMDKFAPLCFFKGTTLKKNSVHCVRIVIRKSQRVRCWIKSFTTCQIMNWQIPKVSVFDLKVLLRVMLWIRIIKTFQALEWKIYKVSKFGWKILPRVKFWIAIFTTCQALNQKVYNLSGFDSKFQQVTHFESKRLQRVKFCMKKVTTCHFLNYKFYNVSDFASKILAVVRFWVEIITVCPAKN